jgi:hypothetical protein
LSQNRGDWSKNFPNRIDVSGETPRFPKTISETVFGVIPKTRDSAF